VRLDMDFSFCILSPRSKLEDIFFPDPFELVNPCSRADPLDEGNPVGWKNKKYHLKKVV